MPRIGLTGGIASGKSTVSAHLAELGAVVIDSDLLAREVVDRGTPVLAAITREFGPTVLSGTGELDRQAMADVVFSDESARRRLEAIVHPMVRERAAAIEASAPPGSVVVHDIPLLVESGQAGDFDLVVVVDADEEVQRQRLQELRQMPAEEAAARIAAQADRQARLAAADYVITNNGTLQELLDSVDRLWGELQQGRDPTS